MDYKSYAEKDLRNYDLLCIAEINLKERLEALRLKSSAAQTSSLSAAPTHGGGSKHEDAILSAIVESDRLTQELKYTRYILNVIRRGLDAISAEDRTILEKFYIHRTRGYIDELCEMFLCEQSQVYRLKDRALRNYVIAAFGVCGIIA